MKVLGRGWQYTTYDLGNGRVLKKYNGRLSGYRFILWEIFPFTGDKPWQIPGFYRGCKETALDSMKKIPTTSVEPWMMGNPKVLNTLDYEQDMMTPLHDLLDSAGVDKAKKIVDDFVALNKILVEKGLIDKSFNITKNFGTDAEGRVILMDLGELYSSQAAIDIQRRERAWAKHYVVDPIKDAVVRAYFIEQMDLAFS